MTSRPWTLFAVVLGGCGTNATPVDCGWVEGTNCWKVVVSAAAVCHDGPGIGSLSPDRLSCEYFSGVVVEFSDPFPPMVRPDYPWDFDVRRAGAVCVEHRDLDGTGERGFSVTTSAGTVTRETDGNDVVFTCPDGEAYAIGAAEATTCASAHQPGIVLTAFEGGGAFSYRADPDAEAEVLVFNCEE
jgi:hypothetical protein